MGTAIMNEGKQALAALIQNAALRVMKGESADQVAEALWPEFRTAVAAAMAELRESEAEGVKRWQEARHGE